MIKAINFTQAINTNNSKKPSFQGLSVKQVKMINILKAKYKNVNWQLVDENLSPEYLKLMKKALKKLESVKKQLGKHYFPLIESKYPNHTYVKKHWFTDQDHIKVRAVHNKIVSIEQIAPFKRLSEIGPKRSKTYHFLRDGETPDMFFDHMGMAKFRNY